MKYALLMMVCLFPFTLCAQEEFLRPDHGDNIIIVSTDTLNKSAFEKASSTLISQGFTIKKKNNVKKILITDPFSYDTGKLTLNIEVSLNEIKIYGMFEPNLAIISGAGTPKQLARKIYYEEAEDSSVRKAWNIMDAFANQLAETLQAYVT